MPLRRLSRRGSGFQTQIGGMDKIISIQTRAATDKYNQPGGAWSDFAPGVWAKLEHITGKEVLNQTEFAAEVTDRWITPYVPSVTPKMRIVYVDIDNKTRYFDILFVQNVEEQGLLLEMLTKEIFSNR